MASAFSQSSPDPQLAALRVPPHSVEAEQSVLGGLLLDNEAWDRVGDILSTDDFYRDDHRRIFRHIAKLIELAKPADVVTVAESIESSEDKDKTGGLAYLGLLAQSTPSAHNIRRYGEIVRERAVLRRLVTTANEIADSAFMPQGKEVGQLLDEAESKIFEIADIGSRGRQGFVEIQPLLAQVMERIDMLYHRESGSDVTGIPTGFADLDQMTSGLQEGDLIIVAGRPSMGKAQPLDARVKTLTGWKAMGDLEVGDALASIDGRPSLVTGVFPQGEREVHRIRFADGRSTECCDEHLWTVGHCDWPNPRTVTTATLRRLLARKGEADRFWVDAPSGDFGHAEPLPIDPWRLGSILGASAHGDPASSSAWFRPDGSRARAMAGESHPEPVTGRVVHCEPARGDICADVIDGEPAWPDESAPAPCARQVDPVLPEMEVDRAAIPTSYLLAGRAARLALLRGLLGAGGSSNIPGGVRFAACSHRLAVDVVELARSLGACARLVDLRPTSPWGVATTGGGPAFGVDISHTVPALFMASCGDEDEASAGIAAPVRLVIESITPSRRTATQCIAVSHPSRLYLADDYVPTHNTAFSINIAEYIAVEQRLPVAVFSMEMGGAQLATRMLGSIGRLDQHRLRTGKLNDDDWARLTHAVSKLHDAPMHIDETPGLNPLELRARARRLHRQYGKLGLIVVDYLQLMSSSKEGENRATEISEISRSLKGLAKELKVPVIALSQLNRSLEQRPNKRPVMSDLRESGAIEQDADLILFIYRDEVYNPDSPDKGKAEIIIGKQRNGPIGMVPVAFLGQYTRFENFASGSY